VAAVVERLGEGVAGPPPGRTVTLLPQMVCGLCGPCRRGDYHICDALRVQGFQAPGCAQELFVAPAERVIPLPEAFTLEQGALVEPAAVAVHAVARGGPVAGRRAVVAGAGPIGNLVAQVARAEGAEVLVTDLSDYRLDVARQCGLEQTSNARREALSDAVGRVLGPAGFDLAFECVGLEDALDPLIRHVGKGGTIIVVGVFGERPRVDMGLVQDHELTLRGTLMYRREDYERAVALMQSGQVRTEPLVTMHFPFERYADAYAAIDHARDRVMKVFIDL